MANKIKTITVRCVGVSPLLMNPMSEEILDSLLTGVRTQINRELTPDQIAAKRIYRENGATGCMGLPAINLIGALKHAGRNVKNGKKAISTAASTTLFSFVTFPQEFVPFDGLDEAGNVPWVPDKRRGVMKNGAASVAVAIVRPKLKEWSFTMQVVLNEAIVGEATLRKLFDEAGNAGVGDFRPQKNGPFGRFAVAEWSSTNDNTAE